MTLSEEAYNAGQKFARSHTWGEAWHHEAKKWDDEDAFMDGFETAKEESGSMGDRE